MWKLQCLVLAHIPQTTKKTSGLDLQKFHEAVHDWSPWEDESAITVREAIALYALCKMAKNHKHNHKRFAHYASTYIIHLALLRRLPLSQRSFDTVHLDDEVAMRNFLSEFSTASIESLGFLADEFRWDAFDLLDGRLFRFLVASRPQFPNYLDEELYMFTKKIKQITSTDIYASFPFSKTTNDSDTSIFKTEGLCTISSELHTSGVLPFYQPILNSYLENIQLIPAHTHQRLSAPKIFKELSHWHNARLSVDRRLPRPKTARELRGMQKWMAVYIRYSASLTNSSGKNIDPERIVVGSDFGNPGSELSRANKRATVTKGKAKSGKNMALETAQALQKGKAFMKAKNSLSSWESQCKSFENEPDLTRRYLKVLRYLNSLTSDLRFAIEAEVLVYSCNTLVSMLDATKPSSCARKAIASLVWSTIYELRDKGMSVSSAKLLSDYAKAMGLPSEFNINTEMTNQLPYRPFIDRNTSLSSLAPATIEFQLEHCGPFLERSFESAQDPRVPFHPDAWQRNVLDAIDDGKSLFVVAPTSAGKTFISFYAMKRILKEDDDGVLVYVAPTKALVNQIAAEIQARFTKTYQHDGRSVWAIHTRDYRINNPNGCQILVTVPHILQIMLMAPSNAESQNSWSRRVKRVIFDEVHCIGQAEDGVIWEQLLLLAPCPIIALSATVGNPLEFKVWLEASEKAKGNELEMIVHSTRYSDLRKFLWRPRPGFVFNGLELVERLPIPGLESITTTTTQFSYIHPIASLVNRNRGTIEDLSLEPRDCYTLWKAMAKHQNKDFPLASSLSPAKALPKLVKKADVVTYEENLKVALQSWMEDRKSPFEAVRQELRNDVTVPHLHDGNLKELALPLTVDLHSQGALPAIFFNYNRVFCEDIVFTLLDKIVEAEDAWKAASPKWTKKVADFERWKKEQVKVQALKEHAAKSKAKKKGRKGDDDIEDGKTDEYPSMWESFDPKEPLPFFSFADETKLSPSEFKDIVEPLRSKGLNIRFISALQRGIGVHHAGMSHLYRQTVEILFRKGFLRVVVSTGTLALGLNMPCKTVVFFGDSVFLTALNYHQAAGRAGRRGFDLLGNVVFAGMSQERAYEIMSSRLPDLRGHFPLSTTLVLRILNLLHHTQNCDFSVRAVRSLLSQTRLYLGGPADKMFIKHHLRFSIEYLRRQHLLSHDGSPLNFSGLVSHLYFTENAVFAFHSLLKEGFFHELYDEFRYALDATLLKLALVLSHIFCRISTGETAWDLEAIHKSPSVVFLPPLPDDAAQLLRKHNQDTLAIFKNYASTFVDQHVASTPDRMLPFTNHEAGSEEHDMRYVDIIKALAKGKLPPTKLRSPFTALSGFGDADFTSIHDLCTTVRSGVFLEESAIPYIPLYPDDTNGTAWNAYLYDFFKHGDIETLVRDNRIKRGDVWFRLKDFSLVLATIVTSLTNFLDMQAGDDGDMAMMDVQDAEEAFQESQEGVLQEESAGSQGSRSGSATKATQKSSGQNQKAKKAVIAESWDDDEADSGGESCYSNASASEKDPIQFTDPAWNGKGENKLPQVLHMFQTLRFRFDEKFLKIWA